MRPRTLTLALLLAFVLGAATPAIASPAREGLAVERPTTTVVSWVLQALDVLDKALGLEKASSPPSGAGPNQPDTDTSLDAQEDDGPPAQGEGGMVVEPGG